MQFKVMGGAPINQKLPPMMLKVMSFLDQQPDGNLFPTFEVCGAVRCSLAILDKFSQYPISKRYSHVVRHKKFFGNKATITQLKRSTKTK